MLLVFSPDLPQPAAARVRLAAAAGRRGLNVVTAWPSDRLTAIRGAVLEMEAETVLVCGDAATQAAAACVAAALERDFCCLPASDTDMLARDIETVSALSGAGDGVDDRHLDLGEVNGITFVNYVAIGLHVLPTTRGAVVTAAATDDRMQAGAGLRTGSPGAATLGRSVLVTNNAFRTMPGGIGGRDLLDTGRLAVIAWPTVARSSEEASAPVAESEVTRIELHGRGPVVADVDGTQRILRTPLRFRLVPHAVRLGARASTWFGPGP